MSEKRLQTIIKEYPKYSEVIKAVVNWFKNNPQDKGIRKEVFFSNHFNYSIDDVNAAFLLLSQEQFLKKIYRILDYDGSKIGKDFESLDEIPSEVSTLWGDKKNIEDVFIVPFYSYY